MITTARDSRAGELLMRDSALQYMSGVKTAAFGRFPDNEMFKKGHDDWYTALRGVHCIALLTYIHTYIYNKACQSVGLS